MCLWQNDYQFTQNLEFLWFLIVTIFIMWSYIFENKEDKQTDSKITKNKDGKVESVSKDRVIARLQVCSTFCLYYIVFWVGWHMLWSNWPFHNMKYYKKDITIFGELWNQESASCYIWVILISWYSIELQTPVGDMQMHSHIYFIFAGVWPSF